MISVFLSYARDDDEPFVARLHDDLTRAGFSVWWDRASMPSRALPFRQEVRDAICTCDRFLVVIGPAATQSDHVRAEWQWALHVCKPVTPLLRRGDHDLLPEELRRFHTPDFRSDTRYDLESQKLQTQLRASIAPSGPLIGVPEVPPHFLQRPAEIRAMEKAVLADSVRPVAVTGTAQRVGLHGMGGIGKSVLAATFARTCDVRRAFPDGIFWIAVGQTPPVTSRQAQLAEALGDSPRAFDDVEQGKARLSALLAGKRCLIVLDDVWQTPHAAAFAALGDACRLLITTRDHGISTSLGATECRIDVLSEDDALRLLAEWAEQAVEDLPADAHDVMRECGRLPLALAIAGAMARDSSHGWSSALHKLRTADLERLRREFPNYPYPDLLRAIRAGVDALPPDVHPRYLDFGVFPEDTPIPEAVLRTYWGPAGLDAHAVQDVVDLLVNRSLMRRDADGRLTLHDLQSDYVHTQCGDRVALHGRLVDAYAATCPAGWAHGPDDGYFFTHLGHHLLEAGRKDELRHLLLDFRWLQAKLKATNVAAVLADFDAFADDEILRAVGSAIRLASHVLATTKGELAAQLIGRLSWHDHPEIVTLLRQAESPGPATSLLPLRTSLSAATGPLVRTMVARGPVRDLAVLPDGFRLFTGGTEVWDARSGDVVMTASPPPAAHFVAMTGDSRILCVDRNMLQLCDLATGRTIDWVALNRGWIDLHHVIAAGEHAVFTRDDEDFPCVAFWNFRTGDSDAPTDGPGGLVDMAALDDRRVLIVHMAGDLVIWDASRFALERRLRRLDGAHRVAVTPDGRFAALAAARRIHWMDIDRDEILWATDLVSPTTPGDVHFSVAAIAISGPFILCGSLAYAQTRGALIAILDAASGRELRRFSGHSASVTRLVPLANGHLASASEDHTIRVWDPVSESTFITAPAHNAAVAGVAVSIDGGHAVSGSYDRTVKIWDLRTGAEIRTLAEHLSGVNAVAALPDGRVVSASHDRTLKIWDHERANAAFTLLGHEADVIGVAATRDGSRVVSLAYDGTLCLWDPAGQSETGRSRLVPASVLALTPDGRRVVLAGKRISVAALDGESEWNVNYDGGRINAVTAADRLAYLADDRGDIVEIDLDERAIRRRTSAGIGGLSGIAVTPDSQRLVVVSWSGILQLWHPERWELLATFHTDGLLTCCAISADGAHVVAGDRSGQVHLLRVATAAAP